MSDYTPERLTISQLNAYARDVLENTFLPMTIVGEVGTLTIARSGHVYLTLKDAQSHVRCVYFSGAKALEAYAIGVGTQVEAWGTVSLYVATGEFQFKIQRLTPVGQGSLQYQFEKLKQTLNNEGLFDAQRKKNMPTFIHDIGLISAPDSAAVEDFIQVATRRFPALKIRIYPALVQGKQALKSLCAALDYFNRLSPHERPQVLVLTRGGGSIEDLWSFNEAQLAYAVSESQIPVVSAVGHEIDFTICDFVADLRAPTPSAAAELLITPLHDYAQRISQYEQRLMMHCRVSGHDLTTRLHQARSRLEKLNPQSILNLYAQKIDYAERDLHTAVQTIRTRYEHRLLQRESQLHALSPQGVLKRGFALLQTCDTHDVITSAKALSSAKHVKAQMHDGSVMLTPECTQ